MESLQRVMQMPSTLFRGLPRPSEAVGCNANELVNRKEITGSPKCFQHSNINAGSSKNVGENKANEFSRLGNYSSNVKTNNSQEITIRVVNSDSVGEVSISDDWQEAPKFNLNEENTYCVTTNSQISCENSKKTDFSTPLNTPGVIVQISPSRKFIEQSEARESSKIQNTSVLTLLIPKDSGLPISNLNSTRSVKTTSSNGKDFVENSIPGNSMLPGTGFTLVIPKDFSEPIARLDSAGSANTTEAMSTESNDLNYQYIPTPCESVLNSEIKDNSLNDSITANDDVNYCYFSDMCNAELGAVDPQENLKDITSNKYDQSILKDGHKLRHQTYFENLLISSMRKNVAKKGNLRLSQRIYKIKNTKKKKSEKIKEIKILKTNNLKCSTLCQFCGREFNESRSLWRHEFKSHKQAEKLSNPEHVRLYNCKQCDKSYTNSVSLLRHKQSIHSTERPFKCSECPRAFITRQLLKRHTLATHAGIKPFPCTICSRCFSRKSNLNTHLRTHTGEKPFRCEKCPEAFSHKCSLVTHVAQKHTIV